MIQAVLRVVAPPEKRDEILEIFRRLKGPTEVTKGCHLCRTMYDLDDDNTITYWVEWDTQEALKQHFQSERFWQILPYIEMSVVPPQVDISHLDRVGGIEVMVGAIGIQAD